MVWMLWAAIASAAPFDVLAQDQGWRDLSARASTWGRLAVRARTIEGTSCYEGSVTVDVPVAALVATADRMRDAARWSRARLPYSEELARDGRAFVLFQVLDTPAWTMAADRYWVIRAETSQRADGSAVYRYERAPSSAWPRVAEALGARRDAMVEPPVSFGTWDFEPTPEGTHVVYRSCADFGGVVPASLQSWVALQQLPDTMEDLVNAAASRAAR